MIARVVLDELTDPEPDTGADAPYDSRNKHFRDVEPLPGAPISLVVSHDDRTADNRGDRGRNVRERRSLLLRAVTRRTSRARRIQLIERARGVGRFVVEREWLLLRGRSGYGRSCGERLKRPATVRAPDRLTEHRVGHGNGLSTVWAVIYDGHRSPARSGWKQRQGVCEETEVVAEKRATRGSLVRDEIG